MAPENGFKKRFTMKSIRLVKKSNNDYNRHHSHLKEYKPQATLSKGGRTGYWMTSSSEIMKTEPGRLIPEKDAVSCLDV
jgi:hypothetical protein